jgi:hypothetical protein
MVPGFFLFTGDLSNVKLYLDPGSGSFILQLLLAAIFGALFIARAFRQKIKSFFIRLFRKKDQPDSQTGAGDLPDKPR